MMILFPNNPDMYLNEDFSGILDIPEKLPPYEPIDAEDPFDDPFVRAIMECMSKPLKGGTHGQNPIN